MPQGKPSLGVGGVDGAENPVGLLVGRVAREGSLRVSDGVDGIVLTRVKPGQLGSQFGRPRIEGNGSLVRLDGFLDPARALEMPREQKVVARVALVGAGLSELTRPRRSDREVEKRQKQKRPHLTDYNDVSRPQDANGIWYSAAVRGTVCRSALEFPERERRSRQKRLRPERGAKSSRESKRGVGPREH